MTQEAEKLDSKYTMVIVAAKRARQLLDGSKTTIETHAHKPVTAALDELKHSKVYYHRLRDGIK